MANCIIPLKEVRTELIVVNSRFIATLAPVFSVDEAKEFIHKVRQEFKDASHNVPAYLVGCGSAVIAHCSDDGEPSGTAGRPALAVLQGSQLGDSAVVVTRYFGGTRLGTGGLVRAYSDAVRAVLDLVQRAQKIPVVTVMLGLPYAYFDQVRLLVAAHSGEITDQDFGAEVTLTLSFPVEKLENFQSALRNLSNGQLQSEFIESGEKIVPLAS